MNIPIKVQLDVNRSNIRRIVLLGFVLCIISMLGGSLLATIETCRISLIRWRMPNATESLTSLYCNTPYDDSRCSVQPANRNDSNYCLSDADAMVGHILPLVTFVMQVALTQELFALSGSYSHIFRNILWLVILFVFIMIAIAVHGSVCYHSFVAVTTLVTGYSLGGFVIMLIVRNGKSCCSHKNPDYAEV